MIVDDRELAIAEAIFPQPAETRAAHATRLLGSAPLHRVQKETLVREVLTMMARDRIDAVLVMDFHRLIGIFTATDACRCFAERLH